MKNYNCDNVADFAHECSRLCHTYSGCQNCPLEEIGCDIVDASYETLAKIIIAVQEWSDGHPEKETEH